MSDVLKSPCGLPAWNVFHVPHDSTLIPAEVRGQLLLTDDELEHELLRMTDHHTASLFTEGVPPEQVVRASVSRLVVDVERFEDDDQEVMAAIRMGAIYTRTHDGRTLRKPPTASERQALLDGWYRPHHLRLQNRVQHMLDRHGRALIVDAHSFPAKPLPYERDQREERPGICLGTDGFHTPPELVDALAVSLRKAGFDVGINAPFSGALVPAKFFRADPRVASLMVEVRRDLYMDESNARVSTAFGSVASAIRSALSDHLATLLI